VPLSDAQRSSSRLLLAGEEVLRNDNVGQISAQPRRGELPPAVHAEVPAGRLPGQGGAAGLRGELPRDCSPLRLRDPRCRVRAGPRPPFRGRLQKPSGVRAGEAVEGGQYTAAAGTVLGAVPTEAMGDAFWTAGYFYRSVGATTNEAIQYYLEHSQRKHSMAVDYHTYLHSKQQRLNNYLAETTTP
jgi:hypothetical protein